MSGHYTKFGKQMMLITNTNFTLRHKFLFMDENEVKEDGRVIGEKQNHA